MRLSMVWFESNHLSITCDSLIESAQIEKYMSEVAQRAKIFRRATNSLSYHLNTDVTLPSHESYHAE
ncbi:MAG: hypothetical protein QMC69_04910 [Gammaproteobacteria bacterium]